MFTSKKRTQFNFNNQILNDKPKKYRHKNYNCQIEIHDFNVDRRLLLKYHIKYKLVEKRKRKTKHLHICT